MERYEAKKSKLSDTWYVQDTLTKTVITSGILKESAQRRASSMNWKHKQDVQKTFDYF